MMWRACSRSMPPVATTHRHGANAPAATPDHPSDPINGEPKMGDPDGRLQETARGRFQGEHDRKGVKYDGRVGDGDRLTSSNCSSLLYPTWPPLQPPCLPRRMPPSSLQHRPCEPGQQPSCCCRRRPLLFSPWRSRCLSCVSLGSCALVRCVCCRLKWIS